jgi:uncharacterized protein YecE (DUF72 family)
MSKKGQIRIGISGWRYSPWRGVFYPADLPQRQELEYASKQVKSIEINGSFYSLQKLESWRSWYEATPDDFVFSVKGSRYITHVRRLQEVEQPLANFFASGLLELKEKLGPLLWQLPPSFRYDAERVESFLNLLPHTTKDAILLARKHEDKVSIYAPVRDDENRPLRHAMEVRHTSFQCRELVEQLRRHNVALVVADTAGKWPFMEDVTSDFSYVRLHGDKELYVSGYTPSAIKRWKDKILSWSQGRVPRNSCLTAPKPKSVKAARDVYVYFDNDVKVHAPYDAMTLAHQLGLTEKQKVTSNKPL